MPDKLTKIWLAALLVCGGLSTAAAEMPASGTKNFVPGGEAPSYFTNEAGAVSTVATDEPAADDGVDQISRSRHFETGLRPSTDKIHGKRGTLAASHSAKRHMAAANSRARESSTFAVRVSNGKAASIGRPSRPTRSAGRTAESRESKAAKAGAGKSGREIVRHVAEKSTSKRG